MTIERDPAMIEERLAWLADPPGELECVRIELVREGRRCQLCDRFPIRNVHTLRHRGTGATLDVGGECLLALQRHPRTHHRIRYALLADLPWAALSPTHDRDRDEAEEELGLLGAVLAQPSDGLDDYLAGLLEPPLAELDASAFLPPGGPALEEDVDPADLALDDLAPEGTAGHELDWDAPDHDAER